VSAPTSEWLALALRLDPPEWLAPGRDPRNHAGMSGTPDDDAPKPRTQLMEVGGVPHLPVQQFRLRVTAGDAAGAVFTSSGTRATVGTHDANHLVLADPTVSRFHCEIVMSEEHAIIRDLGSRNGTRVDSVPVLSAYLRDGARLKVGHTPITFELLAEQVGVPLSGGERFGLALGRSVAMRAVFAVLERAAQSDATVLLTGETGTGKDVAAESLHRESARREGPFVVVDCGAIPAGLLETELFGHEAGAYTGATTDRCGAIEAASGGTLFLDEVGELTPDLQPKLLRALDTRTVQRVGGTRRTPVDVRVVAATNRDLKVEVNTRRFRPDLYYRLAVVEVRLPPLRERLEDLPLLVEHFLAQLGNPPAAAASLRDPEHLAALGHHSWPGNIRELRNYVEQCQALGERAELDPCGASAGPPAIDVRVPIKRAREQWLDHFERRYLAELMQAHGQNVAAAARAAEIDRVHLYRLLSRYGLRR
jgi:two-component system, NtrC family, response regulator GlrR